MIERGRRLTEADAGTNATTRRALAVAGLEQEVANLGAWGKDELHRLVAAFLEVRFPTVVVLNKCDRPSARAHVDRLKAARPGLDLVPCSARIEASLVAARARGEVTYVDGAADFEGASFKAADAAAAAYLGAWGATGTLEAISRAVAKAGARFAYPVADFESLRGAFSEAALGDCVALRPGATVEDAVLAVAKRGHGGDFVRADCLSADGSKRRQAKLRDVVDADCAILKIATNRKAPWQRSHAAGA